MGFCPGGAAEPQRELTRPRPPLPGPRSQTLPPREGGAGDDHETDLTRSHSKASSVFAFFNHPFPHPWLSSAPRGQEPAAGRGGALPPSQLL